MNEHTHLITATVRVHPPAAFQSSLFRPLTAFLSRSVSPVARSTWVDHGGTLATFDALDAEQGSGIDLVLARAGGEDDLAHRLQALGVRLTDESWLWDSLERGEVLDARPYGRGAAPRPPSSSKACYYYFFIIIICRPAQPLPQPAQAVATSSLSLDPALASLVPHLNPPRSSDPVSTVISAPSLLNALRTGAGSIELDGLTLTGSAARGELQLREGFCEVKHGTAGFVVRRKM
ncbi:hypothetical protein JCM10207_004537 [Rhodosporidiobolus poonsookiae]